MTISLSATTRWFKQRLRGRTPITRCAGALDKLKTLANELARCHSAGAASLREGVSRAGTGLLVDLAVRVGLTGALSAALCDVRERASQHDPGVVTRDLAVMLADGGDCVADLGALRDQELLCGRVASDATAWRLIDALCEDRIDQVRQARAEARRRAWARGARSERARSTWPRRWSPAIPARTALRVRTRVGYGFHPLLCYLDESGEALAGLLRPVNAGDVTP